MKRLDKIISNPIVENIIAILYFIVVVIITILTCIAFIILLIPAIPYAIVRGVCNLDYYKQWFEFAYRLKKEMIKTLQRKKI